MATPAITFQLEGWAELVEELKNLPDNVKRNGINNVLNKDSKVIEAKAKTLVDIDAKGQRRKGTGKLQSFIKAKKRRTRSGNFFKYTIGTLLGQRPEPKRKRVKGKLVPNAKYGQQKLPGVFYSPFIEFGTSRIPEKSFLRASLEETAPSTTASIISNVKKEINASLVRHQRKVAKRNSQGFK